MIAVLDFGGGNSSVLCPPGMKIPRIDLSDEIATGWLWRVRERGGEIGSADGMVVYLCSPLSGSLKPFLIWPLCCLFRDGNREKRKGAV